MKEDQFFYPPKQEEEIIECIKKLGGEVPVEKDPSKRAAALIEALNRAMAKRFSEAFQNPEAFQNQTKKGV